MRNKMLFALPNLFTLTSIAFAMYAIIIVSEGGGAQVFVRACIALTFSGICDMMDGRVARLTKTQSAFGVQLDSLADLVAFGVAPAIVMYKWNLHSLGLAGLGAAIMFVLCGAMRLARFNVIAERHT
ncbi:MAG: CDP-alcohol phosphatidyltransferase family protein, partial [Myxococcota bacterium]